MSGSVGSVVLAEFDVHMSMWRAVSIYTCLPMSSMSVQSLMTAAVWAMGRAPGRGAAAALLGWAALRAVTENASGAEKVEERKRIE